MKAESKVQKIGKSLQSWEWIERLFHWIITSGGTLAGIVFLVSSLWLSDIKAVPDFFNKYMPHDQVELLTYLSKIAFTGLPEIILFVSILKTLDQIKLCYGLKKGLAKNLAIMWAVLFGIPTLIFVSFSLVNIGLSLANTDYTMPDSVVIGRGLTCFLYALLSFVYDSRGRNCFANQIAERDAKNKELEASIDAMKLAHSTEIDLMKRTHSTEIETLVTAYSNEKLSLAQTHLEEVTEITQHLNAASIQVNLLAERASSLASQGLDSYQLVLDEWINREIKTVTIEEIVRVTGHSRQRINAAISSGKIKPDRRNTKKFRVTSIVEWLRTIPVPIVESDRLNGNGNGHDRDTDALSLPLLTIVTND